MKRFKKIRPIVVLVGILITMLALGMTASAKCANGCNTNKKLYYIVLPTLDTKHETDFYCSVCGTESAHWTYEDHQYVNGKCSLCGHVKGKKYEDEVAPKEDIKYSGECKITKAKSSKLTKKKITIPGEFRTVGGVTRWYKARKTTTTYVKVQFKWTKAVGADGYWVNIKRGNKKIDDFDAGNKTSYKNKIMKAFCKNLKKGTYTLTVTPYKNSILDAKKKVFGKAAKKKFTVK